MKTGSLTFRLTAILLGFGAALLARADDKSTDLAIVVNKACKLEDVGLADVQKYFRADKSKAPDGTKIALVVQDAGRPERAAALKSIYKMSETEYTDFFVEATFTGAVAAAPKALTSGAAVVKFVSDTPGGLGYVRGSEADDSVRILKVDGKLPGEAGYKLTLK